MRVGQPLRTGVVEVGQRTGFEVFGRGVVSGHWAFGIAGNGFVDPFHPFGRVEPAVAEGDEPLGRFGNGRGARVFGIVRGRDVRRQPRGNGKVSKVVVGV